MLGYDLFSAVFLGRESLSPVLVPTANCLVYILGGGRYAGTLDVEIDEVVPAVEPPDLFAALDAFVKANMTRVQVVFEEFDTDGNGVLDSKELPVLLKRVVPNASEADVAHFALLVDADGDGLVSLQELLVRGKGCVLCCHLQQSREFIESSAGSRFVTRCNATKQLASGRRQSLYSGKGTFQATS